MTDRRVTIPPCVPPQATDRHVSIQRAAAALSGVFVFYYLYASGCGPLEALRFLAGAAVLWGPCAWLVWGLTRRAIPDRPMRLAFSLISAYALTTCWFFACASLGAQWAFTASHAALAVALLLRASWTQGPPGSRRRALRVDWILFALVAASLVTTLQFKIPFEVVRQDARILHRYLLYPDHLYHVGQVYELDRHIPPLQASIRAGSPERAYHHLSHLTTLLLGRYTRTTDFLRVHLLYHYTVIETLVCLALFAIARALTNSRDAGYLAVVLMYPLAFAWPALRAHPWPIFYFTVFPHASSGLQVTAGALPQMYSGLTIVLGTMIGVLALCSTMPSSSTAVTPVLLALLVAATMRFRVQWFIALAPAFLLLMLTLAVRRRSKVFPAAGLVLVLVSAAFYLEMRRPEYLASTQVLTLGYNALPEIAPFLNAWPLSETVHRFVESLLRDPAARKWAWQIVSICGFTFFDIIGLPLAAATIFFLSTARARRRFAPFSLFVLSATTLSIVGGIVLTMPYDWYSVPVQLLTQSRWFLFPLAAPVLWWLLGRLPDGTNWRLGVAPMLLTVAVASVVIRGLAPPQQWWWSMGLVDQRLENDEWLALRRLREHAPRDAVVLAARYNGERVPSLTDFVVSGVTGRAAFLEMPGNPVDLQASRMNPEDDRPALLSKLWNGSDPQSFCGLLESTPADYVLDFADHALAVRDAECLRQEWRGPSGFATIWRVVRDVPKLSISAHHSSSPGQ